MRKLSARDTSMVVLRLGHFIGEHYGLGMLPLLLPRLRTHLVPWVGKGRTTMPLIAGQDVGRAMALAAVSEQLEGFMAIDVAGKELPEFAREFADSWGQFFLKFIVSHPAVTCAIPATSKPRHMADNLGAGFGTMPDATMRKRMADYFSSI